MRLGVEATAFLQTGCAIVVGTLGPDGAPHASRGWGLSAESLDPETLRLLVSADDPTTISHLAAGGAVAVTGADVRTLYSIQVKGHASALEPATDEDRVRAARFSDEFLTAVVETDGVDRKLLERLVPRDYVACTLTVEELYDQTPGPGAGAPIAPPGS